MYGQAEIGVVQRIDEFAAQTQSNAEGGRNAGGIVNVVLRSGTNQLHGSAYYFNRNEAYGAASPFTPSGASQTSENERLGLASVLEISTGVPCV